MSKDLYDIAKRALDEADDDYADGIFELNYLPEKAGEILEHKLDCQGQRVFSRCFWLDDDDADLDSALAETIEFCTTHKNITDYAVVNYSAQDLVFVVYLMNDK